MKKLLILSIAIMSVMASCNKGGKVEIKSESDSLSNAIGTLMGAQLKSSIKDVKLNAAIVAQAMGKVFDAETLDTNAVEEAENFFKNYMTVVVPQQKKAKGDKFLSETAAKSGVVKSDSGLLYEIVEAGDSNVKPTEADTVVAHYKGTLINGDKFDSSYDRGEPATFPLNRVIKGWTEGLQLIGKGGKIKLYIPSDLAYGNQGQLAGEVLIFDVELVDVKKSAE